MLISKKRCVIFVIIVLTVIILNTYFAKSANLGVNKENTINNKFIDVPYISQKGVLPTGCEIISTLMLLRYYDYNIELDDFINNYIPFDSLETINGKLYGPNPNAVFVGNPREISGYGCYAPVITNALNDYFNSENTAVNTTNTSIEALVDKYIDYDIPVLLWTSINLKETKQGTKWILKDTNKKFSWISGEHCMVLVGYNENEYYFNDPYNSNGIVAYNKKLVKQRFKELGMQSVVIKTK